jgi:hypothetical protein
MDLSFGFHQGRQRDLIVLRLAVHLGRWAQNLEAVIGVLKAAVGIPAARTMAGTSLAVLHLDPCLAEHLAAFLVA